MDGRAAFGVLALLMVAGCGSAADAGVATVVLSPSPSDIPGQIMSVTGRGFTICDVDDVTVPYLVTVCGDLVAARAALERRFPGRTSAVAYAPGDGGPHTPQELVLRYWIWHTTASGFTVISTMIIGGGKVSVGVQGDLARARAVFEQRFPGRTTVHAAKPMRLIDPVVIDSPPPPTHS